MENQEVSGKYQDEKQRKFQEECERIIKPVFQKKITAKKDTKIKKIQK